MAKKNAKTQDFAPDNLFYVKDMAKRIKFILKQENLFQNREDQFGYVFSKITKENPVLRVKFNNPDKLDYISKILTVKYNYFVNIIDGELYIKTKSVLDDFGMHSSILDQTKDSFQNFEDEGVDQDEQEKRTILRNRYKKVIGLIRTHFPMDYNFTKNSSNGYRATRIKSSQQPYFQLQFPTNELTDKVFHFLNNLGYKTSKIDPTTFSVNLEKLPEENDFVRNILETEFSAEQLSNFWDLLNANGLVLVDVNNHFSILDLFNGKGLCQINKNEFINIIKNQ